MRIMLTVSAMLMMAAFAPRQADAQDWWSDPPVHINAFANFYDPFTIYARGEQGRLNIEPAADSDRAFTGSIFGDQATGYRRGSTVVIIRWRDGKPYEAYIGGFEGNIGSETGTLEGIVYALGSEADATDEQNRWSFSGGQDQAMFNPTSPEPIDNEASPLEVANGAWFARANSTIDRPMVLNVDASSGDVTGWLGGDKLVGHYAKSTGSLVFVRFDDPVPGRVGDEVAIQVYTARLNSRGLSVDGQFHALSDVAGGVFNATNTFNFAMRDRRDFYRIRHEWQLIAQQRVDNWCIGFRNGTLDEGATLRHNLCDADPDFADEFGILDLGRPDEHIIVVRHSGKCLTADLRQHECNGSRRQEFGFTPYISANYVLIEALQFLSSCMIAVAPEASFGGPQLRFGSYCDVSSYAPSPYTEGRTWRLRSLPNN